MKITSVLHCMGPKMDFYSVDYFGTIQTKPIFKKDLVYGYCKVDKETAAVINVTDIWAENPDWDVRSELETYQPYIVSNPLVPPVLIRTSRTRTERDATFAAYYLSKYEKENCPKYVDPYTDLNCKVYTKQSDVVIEVRNNLYSALNSMPIVNGVCCFPKLVDGHLAATNGTRFFKDLKYANRKVQLVDFNRVGGATFVKMGSCKGSLTGATVPGLNSDTQSLLVVLDGRILLPYEYDVVGGTVAIDTSKLSPAQTLDRLACEGAFRKGTRFVRIPDGLDLYNSENSFFVIVNKPNLQVVEWATIWRNRDRDFEQGSNTYESSFRNQMDVLARGLLYDKHTRAVVDYSREEHTSTFYADGSDEETEGKLKDWKASTFTVRWGKPLVLLAGTSDNFMSATGALMSMPTDVSQEDAVLWPEFVALDFIFRG